MVATAESLFAQAKFNTLCRMQKAIILKTGFIVDSVFEY